MSHYRIPDVLLLFPGGNRESYHKIEDCLQGKKKHINKFAGLSRDWVGCQKFVYVLFFGSFLMGGGGKHINKIPQVKILFTCFFLYVFFRSLCLSPTEMIEKEGKTQRQKGKEHLERNKNQGALEGTNLMATNRAQAQSCAAFR